MQPKEVPEHHVREAVNPRTGRRERVFVDLESVYPDRSNPAHEMSFEELRAIKRGWMDKDWRKQKQPLQQISGNAAGSESLPDHLAENLTIDTRHQYHGQDEDHGGQPSKSHRTKSKGESSQTQTSESPDF